MFVSLRYRNFPVNEGSIHFRFDIVDIATLTYAFQNVHFLFLITFISQELEVKDITTILGYSAPTHSADSILSKKTYIFGLNVS